MSISFPIEDWIFGCFFVSGFFFFFSFFLLITLRIQERQRERKRGRARVHNRAHPKVCVRAKKKILNETCE